MYDRVKAALFTVALALASAAPASGANDFYRYNPGQTGERYYVFADSTDVRTGAGGEFDKSDQLFAGQEVEILADDGREKRGFDSHNGVSAQWIKVKYRKGKETHQGFIWSGALSYERLNNDDSRARFVFGMADAATVCAKTVSSVWPDAAIKGEEQVDANCFELGENADITEIEGRIVDGALPSKSGGISVVLQVRTSGESLLTPISHFYFLWDGVVMSKLIEASTFSSPDGFSHAATVLFPRGETDDLSDLVVRVTSYRFVEKAPDGTETVRMEADSNLFRWNGERLIGVTSGGDDYDGEAHY